MCLLRQFPNIRDTYFIIGEPNEKKTEMDSAKGLEEDPRYYNCAELEIMNKIQ